VTVLFSKLGGSTASGSEIEQGRVGRGAATGGAAVGTRLGLFQRRQIVPRILRWRSEQFDNHLQLIHLGFASKERFAQHEFGQYATSTPDIHRCGILDRSDENFRGSVPQGNDLVGEILLGTTATVVVVVGSIMMLMIVHLVQNGRFHRSRQSKISQFQFKGIIQQNVGTLNVAMHVLVRVHILQGLEKLPKYALDLYFGKLIGNV
jgi:hypothetical protein